MATRVEEIPLESGGFVLVEVSGAEGRGRQKAANLKKAKKKFEDAWRDIQPAVKSMIDQVRAMSPTEAEVTFGIKLTGTGNAVFASGSAEANFEVRLCWTQ